ncbi:MAG: endolytic transglycosylase MltG [bacterium]
MLKKIIILSLIIIAASVFFYWRGLNSPVSSEGEYRIFIVNKGEPAEKIADNLKKENLIRSAFYFKHEIKSGDNLKAGEYMVSPKLSAREIIKILASGNIVNRETAIKIIEGWSNKSIGDYLEKNNLADAEKFMVLAESGIGKWKFDFAKPDFLNDSPANANLEGYLFPDTYRIFEDASAEEIISKMLDNFGKKISSEMAEEIKRQKKNIHEIIIMASVIEKEVRSREDMKIVSGIFWNRIKNGQALESCATLAYILGLNKEQYSIEDTKIDSPYNTYKYRGLPPGPIANPGLNAIMAAIYPEDTDYNYFLSDPATGKTIYSKTFDEHNRNKYKYLK